MDKVKIVNFEIEKRDWDNVFSNGTLINQLAADTAKAICIIKVDGIEMLMQAEVDVPDEALKEIAAILERYIK